MVWRFGGFVCGGRLEFDGFKQKRRDLRAPIICVRSSPGLVHHRLVLGVVISFSVFSLLAEYIFQEKVCSTLSLSSGHLLHKIVKTALR